METLPISPQEMLRPLPINRGQLQLFKQDFIQEIAENGDALKAAVQLKAMEDLVDSLRKDKKLREMIMIMVDKYPEKIFEYLGCDIEKAELGTKYDYSKDRIWNELKISETAISKKREGRENLLKVLKSEMADPETGEIIVPATKTSESYIKITIK